MHAVNMSILGYGIL